MDFIKFPKEIFDISDEEEVTKKRKWKAKEWEKTEEEGTSEMEEAF